MFQGTKPGLLGSLVRKGSVIMFDLVYVESSLTKGSGAKFLTQRNDKVTPIERRSGPKTDRTDESPGWADGLRKLYNSVVEEPLPDSFQELLKKLDKADDE